PHEGTLFPPGPVLRAHLGAPGFSAPRSSIGMASGPPAGPIAEPPPPLDPSRPIPVAPCIGDLRRRREEEYRHRNEEPPDLPGSTPMVRIKIGGMGVVWRVRDPEFDRALAVKVIKWELMEPDDFGKQTGVGRFLAEAQITAQLAHPFIVPVHARGWLHDGRPYFTMKLVEGDTLAALLGDRQDPGTRRMEFLQIFSQICQAVAFAHGRGVIHRDLKPSNVMVGAHGEVQVMDWGLAKSLTGPEAPGVEAAVTNDGPGEGGVDREHHTKPGSALGPAPYTSPEQARGLVAAVDRRSDVFGLGAILCEILTGQAPYSGGSRDEIRALAA